METALVIVIAILAILVLGLFALSIVLVLKFLKLKEDSKNAEPQTLGQNIDSKQIPDEIKKAIDQAKSIGNNLVGRACVDHPELPAKGQCAISGQIYCELCLTKENDVKVARKYLNILLDSKWEHIFMLHNERVGADKINELMRVKRNLWEEQELPLITQKQFKINIEIDKIEDYTAVMAREQDSERVKRMLDFLEVADDTAAL